MSAAALDVVEDDVERRAPAHEWAHPVVRLRWPVQGDLCTPDAEAAQPACGLGRQQVAVGHDARVVVDACRRRTLQECLGKPVEPVLTEQRLAAVPGHVEGRQGGELLVEDLEQQPLGLLVQDRRHLASKQYGQSKLRPSLVTMVSANELRSWVLAWYRRPRTSSSSVSSVTIIRPPPGRAASRPTGSVVTVEDWPDARTTLPADRDTSPDTPL